MLFGFWSIGHGRQAKFSAQNAVKHDIAELARRFAILQQIAQWHAKCSRFLVRDAVFALSLVNFGQSTGALRMGQ
jgi:hypothetical protein